MTTDRSEPGFGSSERPVALCRPTGVLCISGAVEPWATIYTTGGWLDRTRSGAYHVDLDADVAGWFPAT